MSYSSEFGITSLSHHRSLRLAEMQINSLGRPEVSQSAHPFLHRDTAGEIAESNIEYQSVNSSFWQDDDILIYPPLSASHGCYLITPHILHVSTFAPFNPSDPEHKTPLRIRRARRRRPQGQEESSP